MRLKVVLTAFLSVLAVSAEASKIVDANSPRLKTRKGKTEVYIPPKALAALKKWNPEFQVLKSSDFIQPVRRMFTSPDEVPEAALGDFNGDGFADLALIGKVGSKPYAVLVVTSGTDWQVKLLETWDLQLPEATKKPDEGMYIYAMKKTSPKFERLEEHKAYKGDVALIEAYGGVTSAYFLKDNNLVEIPGAKL